MTKHISNILSIPILTWFIFTGCSSSGNDVDQQNGTSADQSNIIFVLADQWRESAGAEMPVPNPDFDPERRYTWGRHPERVK